MESDEGQCYRLHRRRAFSLRRGFLQESVSETENPVCLKPAQSPTWKTALRGARTNSTRSPSSLSLVRAAGKGRAHSKNQRGASLWFVSCVSTRRVRFICESRVCALVMQPPGTYMRISEHQRHRKLQTLSTPSRPTKPANSISIVISSTRSPQLSTSIQSLLSASQLRIIRCRRAMPIR